MEERRAHCLQTLCGSPEYAAPEVYLREGYDERCDLWSTGIVIFVLLGGYVPFETSNAAELPGLICSGDYYYDDKYWSDVSQDARDCIDMLLQVDPNKRASSDRALKSQWLKRGDSQLVEEGSVRNFHSFNNSGDNLNSSQHFNVDLRRVETKRGKLTRDKNKTNQMEWFRNLPSSSSSFAASTSSSAQSRGEAKFAKRRKRRKSKRRERCTSDASAAQQLYEDYVGNSSTDDDDVDDGANNKPDWVVPMESLHESLDLSVCLEDLALNK